MKKRVKHTTLCLWACFIALTALLFSSGMLDKQKIWPGLTLEYESDQRTFVYEDEASYGVKTSGPYTEMPAGVYRLKWQIETDGTGNLIHLRCSNGVAITPAALEITPNTFEGEAYFEIEDTLHNFRINIEFLDGTYLKIHNLRLYTPMYTDHYFSLCALILAALLLWYLHSQHLLPQERREILVPLIAAVIFASIPVLREDSIMTHDTAFHAARLHNLADSLFSGQFPARAGGYTYNGYGAVTSIFYPDHLLYPFALMLRLGASMTYVLNVLLISINALTAVFMYFASKRIFSNRYAGVFSAILYVCNGFRLDRLYDSLMVGQMLAMAFLPLFFLGLWEVFFGDKNRWPLLVAGATLVFQSHMLSTMMCGAIAALTFVVYLRKVLREGRLKPILYAILITLLLNLISLVPLATTYLSGVTTSVLAYDFRSLTHEAVQMLGMDKELGLALLLGIAALFCHDGAPIRRESRADIIRLLLVSVVCLWMCTDMFPWSYVFVLTNNFPEIIQFPWRFLVIAVPFLSLCAGFGYACLLQKNGIRGVIAVLAVTMLCTTPVINEMLQMNVLEFGHDASSYILTPEYQFEGTCLEDTISRDVLTDGDIFIEDYRKEGTRIFASIDAREDATVTFPLFGFEGYAAELNGQPIPWSRGENNRLCISMPAGTQGELRIWFEGLLLWRISDIISLLTLILFGTYLLRRRTGNRRILKT